MKKLKIYLVGLILLLLSIGLSFLVIKLRYAVSFGNYIDPIRHLFLFGPALASLILILIFKKDSISMISFNKIQNLKAFFIVLILMISAVILSIVFEYFLGFISFQNNDKFFFLFNHQFSPVLGSLIWLLLLLLHSGFAEEFAWRGYLFSKLRTLSWIEMILYLNSIWAIWHFPFMPFHKIHQYILFWILCIEFGTILIYVRLKTKSVISSMILHPVVVFCLSVLIMPYFKINNHDGAGWPNYIVALIFLPISVVYYKKGRKLYNNNAR